PPAAPAATPPAETDPLKMAAPNPTVVGAEKKSVTEDKGYMLGVPDTIDIKVWGNGNLSSQQTIRPDGKITIGLINDIQASGMVPEELGRQIGEKLKEAGILKDPKVTVTVIGINSKKFEIIGEVTKPGSYNVTGPLKVLQALVNAGGFPE